MDKSAFIQDSFRAGLDMFSERTKLPEGAYAFLVNGRSRFGKIRPVRKPAQLTEGLPSVDSGYRYQGLYGVGNFGVVFASGGAYVRNFAPSVDSGSFYRLDNLAMSPGVDTIYLEVVPASTINFPRTSSDSTPSGEVSFLGSIIAPSPQAAVVQDGINQPWVILSNGSARITYDFSQWKNNPNEREYVPIGKQMIYVGDKLYIADPAGAQVYQSVSGRPLDFVISIDNEGNKLASEDAGGAKNNSTRAFYDTITCLGRIASDDGSFYIGSPRNSVISTPDFTRTQFNEPFFKHRQIASTGALNQFSFLGDVNGDTCFVDGKTIRSFNAILNSKNEGRNSPFSLLISSLFEGVDQNVTAAGQFDNYSAYALNTKYGAAVVWYDELRQCWEAIDIYDNVDGYIRQFATIVTEVGQRMLLFLTTAGKVYQFNPSSGDVANCQVYIGDWSSGDPKIQLDIDNVKVILEDAETSGTLLATLYVDNKKQEDVILSKTITQNYNAATAPVSLPFGDSAARTVNNINFDVSRINTGYKIGVLLSWNCMANLTYISASGVNTSVMAGNVMSEQQLSYLQNKTILGLG